MNHYYRPFTSGKLPKFYTLKDLVQALAICALLTSPGWLGMLLDVL